MRKDTGETAVESRLRREVDHLSLLLRGKEREVHIANARVAELEVASILDKNALRLALARVAELERAEFDLESENARLRQDRAEALDVKTTEGLTASEWLHRTARSDARAEKAEARVAELKESEEKGWRLATARGDTIARMKAESDRYRDSLERLESAARELIFTSHGGHPVVSVRSDLAQKLDSLIRNDLGGDGSD